MCCVGVGYVQFRKSCFKKNEKRRADRRNEEGLTKREQEKVNTLNKVRELVRKGLKNKDIAEKLKISVRQVQRLKKEV